MRTFITVTIIILALVIGGAAAYGIITGFSELEKRFLPKSQDKLDTTSQIPAVAPEQIPQQADFGAELEKIKPILPYQSQDFTIEYSQDLNAVSVTVLAAENITQYRDKKAVAESFIKTKVENVCTLNIFWKYDGVIDGFREGAERNDLITTECP